MSKAPSKKALAEAGRRKLEAFRRAKAEGTGAKKTKAAAAPFADSDSASAEIVLPATGPLTAAADAEPAPNGDCTQLAAPAASTAEAQQHAPQQPPEAASPAPVEGSGAPAAGAAVPAAVPPAPVAPVHAHAVTPRDGAAAIASSGAFLLPVSRPDHPTAAGAPPRPAWLPPSRPQAAQPTAIQSRSTAASGASAISSSWLPPPDAATAHGAAALQTLPLQPMDSPAVVDGIVAATGSANSLPTDPASSMLATQSPGQAPPSLDASPSSPPSAEQEAAAKAALRASFEASHSPFIALSRTTSGKASSISAAIESASADGAGTDSRRPSGTLLAEAASRLSGYSTTGEDSQLIPSSRPASAASSGAGRAASPSMLSGSKQPWYAKLFAPQPAGGDTARGSPASAVASSPEPPPPTQPDAAALAGSPAAADAVDTVEPAAALPQRNDGSGGQAAGAAADLGSALEAFMGSDDDDGPLPGPNRQPTGEAAQRLPAAVATAPMQPSVVAVPPGSSGYGVLADGYLGAAGGTEPAAAAGVAVGSARPAGDGPGAGASAVEAPVSVAAGAAGSAAAMTSLRLGRPVSFQDWAGNQQLQRGLGSPTSNDSSPLRKQRSEAREASTGRSTATGHPQPQPVVSAAQQPWPWEHTSHSRPSEQSSSTSAISPGGSNGHSALPSRSQSDAALQRLPALQPPWSHQATAEAQPADPQHAAVAAEESEMPGDATGAAGKISQESSAAEPASSAASEDTPQPAPPPKHSASAALANGISAWLTAPSTPEASTADAGRPAPDRSTAFLQELAASGPASGGEGRTAAALREHIDQLTREAFELRRGLTQQADLTSTLAAENAALAEDFNREKERNQELEADLGQLHSEVAAQSMALEALAAERDAARATAREASDRAKALAAEVVALEEARIATRAAELRASAAARDASEQAQTSRAQVARLASERETLAAAVSSLQAEKQALRVKLRRAGGSVDAAAAAAAAEAQQPELQQPQPHLQPQPLAQSPPQQQAQAQPQPEPQLPASRAADLQTESTGAAIGAEPAAASAAAREVPSDSVLETSASAAEARPAHVGMVAAGTLAQPAVAQEPDVPPDHVRHSRRIAAASAGAAHAAQTAAQGAKAAGPAVAVLQQLLPWRLALADQAALEAPAGSSAGGVPADEAARAVAQRQAAALAAITRMVQQLADEKRSCLAALEAQQAEIAEARTAARDARKKLVATQQRLELAVGRNMLQHGLNGVNGVMPASAPASPAQQLRPPPRPGSPQPHFNWLNNIAAPSGKQRRTLL